MTMNKGIDVNVMCRISPREQQISTDEAGIEDGCHSYGLRERCDWFETRLRKL